MSNGLIFMAFKIKQADIAERLCINRLWPEKKCKGKCYLNKQLNKNNNDKTPVAPCNKLLEQLKINLFLSFFDKYLIEINSDQFNKYFIEPLFFLQYFQQAFLDPPR